MFKKVMTYVFLRSVHKSGSSEVSLRFKNACSNKLENEELLKGVSKTEVHVSKYNCKQNH